MPIPDPDSDPTQRLKAADAMAWFAEHPDAGPREYAQAQAAVLRATPEQARKLEQRVKVWRHRSAQRQPPNLHTLPQPEPTARACDPATATELDGAAWLARQAFDAITLSNPQSPGYATLLRAAREAHERLIALQHKEKPAEEVLTQQEIRDRLIAEAAEVPEALLEVWVVEWARRKGLVITVDGRGNPQLQRRTG